MGIHRGQRAGWYLGWLGGSIWMFGLVLTCFVERLRWYGIAALAAAVFNLALIVHLAPWKHPNVQIWKLCLPLMSLQIVIMSAAFALFDPHDPSTRYEPYKLALLALIILPFIGGKRWNDRFAKPKPSTTAVDGLE